jgi:ATP-dependent DNA helicase PIF1
LNEKCIITASTGVAAFNIGGYIVHSNSGLGLPVNECNQGALQCDTLKHLQKRFKNVSLVVIDEISMVGLKTLYWIDQRLRQIAGKMHLRFGGISVLLVGDFAQLPPVGDTPLFQPPKADSNEEKSAANLE